MRCCNPQPPLSSIACCVSASSARSSSFPPSMRRLSSWKRDILSPTAPNPCTPPHRKQFLSYSQGSAGPRRPRRKPWRRSTTPPSGWCSPAISLSRVDLPTPLRPSRQMRSPFSTCRLTSSSTEGPPNARRTLRILIKSHILVSLEKMECVLWQKCSCEERAWVAVQHNGLVELMKRVSVRLDGGSQAPRMGSCSPWNGRCETINQEGNCSHKAGKGLLERKKSQQRERIRRAVMDAQTPVQVRTGGAAPSIRQDR